METKEQRIGRMRLWNRGHKCGRFEFSGPHGPVQAFAAISPDQIHGEMERGWPIGERRQLTGTICATRIE